MNSLAANLDSLQEIAYKLDDATLHNLGRNSGLMVQLTKILQSNDFWYHRTEFRAGRNLRRRLDVDWTRIYYAIDKLMSDPTWRRGEPVFSYMTNITDSDMLDVIIEVLDPVPDSLTGLSVQKIANISMLNLLIDKGLLIYNDKSISESWYKAGRRQVADALVAMLSDEAIASPKFPDLLSDIIRLGASSAAIILMSRRTMNREILDIALTQSIATSDLDLVATLLDTYDYSSDTQASILIKSMKNYDPGSKPPKLEIILEIASRVTELDVGRIFLALVTRLYLQVYLNAAYSLLDLYPYTKHLITTDFLAQSRVFASLDKNTFDFVAACINPSMDNNFILRNVLIHSKSEYVQYVLNHPLVDPMINLDALLRAANGWGRHIGELSELDRIIDKTDQVHHQVSLTSNWSRERFLDYPEEDLVEKVRMLVASPRFRVELLTVEQIRFVSFCLKEVIDKKVDSALLHSGLRRDQLGTMMECEIQSEVRSEIRSELSRTCYKEDIVLRFIILKRPTRAEILDWMIELRLPYLSIAAGNVLDDRLSLNEELLPIEALMYEMLHPSTQPDILTSLREHVSEQELVRATCLVAAYRG